MLDTLERFGWIGAAEEYESRISVKSKSYRLIAFMHMKLTGATWLRMFCLALRTLLTPIEGCFMTPPWIKVSSIYSYFSNVAAYFFRDFDLDLDLERDLDSEFEGDFFGDGSSP